MAVVAPYWFVLTFLTVMECLFPELLRFDLHIPIDSRGNSRGSNHRALKITQDRQVTWGPDGVELAPVKGGWWNAIFTNTGV